MSEQTKNLLGGNYNPDVLECLANLSNDEVFTPPKVVNQMLDMLPPETWNNPNLKFLDPACKTGVFLREIAKRLIVGLEEEIPNLNRRLDHIFKNQLYGIAITELTALTSRRTLYCSKYANGKYSVAKGYSDNTGFQDPDGNIRFVPINHTWENGKCKYCGASASQYQRADDLETHAYEFIHTNNPEEIFGMKFDVIIGNPPYQMSDGGAQASAKPIYNYFVDNANKLSPLYVCMIIPARWMIGGKGLDDFRERMINDTSIKVMHDYVNSKDVFGGVDIKGGICYYLRDKNYSGPCDIYTHNDSGVIESTRTLREGDDDIFIRQPMLVSIKKKVQSFAESNILDVVSARKPYGLAADTTSKNATKKYHLEPFFDEPIEGGLKILGLNERGRRTHKYIPKDYKLPRRKGVGKYKVFVPNAYGCGAIGEVPSTPVLGTPVLGTPVDICTETFLQMGPFDTAAEAENFLSYLRTKFFRCLVSIVKQTQHAARVVYKYVPMQDFSKPWTDEELYKKYNLSEEEIKFIEENIAPMEDK